VHTARQTEEKIHYSCAADFDTHGYIVPTLQAQALQCCWVFKLLLEVVYKHTLLYRHAQQHRTQAKLLEGTHDTFVVCRDWSPQASIVHNIRDCHSKQVVQYKHVCYTMTDGSA
jgi:hypothetical protein